MATVTGLTKERMLEIEAASIVDGSVDENGHLILTRHDQTTIDAGSLIPAVIPEATQSQQGVIEIATTAEVLALTDVTRAVSPGTLEPLATDILNRLAVLEVAPVQKITLPAENAPITEYPLGVSVAEAFDDSGELWSLNDGDGFVVTHRISSTRNAQVFHQSHSSGNITSKAWVRVYGDDEWSPWTQFAGPKDYETYTPLLEATTTDPTLGSGAEAIGRFIVDYLHQRVKGQFAFKFGSGMNAGSGVYSVTFPTPASGFYSGSTGQADIWGNFTLRDSSNSSASRLGFLDRVTVSEGPNGVAVAGFALLDGSNTHVAHAVPWAWATGDALVGSFDYPIDI